MGWLSDRWEDAKDTTSKVMGAADPIGSAILGKTLLRNSSVGKDMSSISQNFKRIPQFENKLSTGTVKTTSDALGDAADSLGINSTLPRWLEGKADKDSESLTRKWTNAAVATAAGYGAYAGLAGMFGGAGAGAGAGAGGGISGIAGADAALGANAAGYYGGLTAGSEAVLPAVAGAATGGLGNAVKAAGSAGGGGGGSGGSGGWANDLAGLVGGAYDAYAQGKAADEMRNWLDSNQAKVEGYMNPNSPEYSALWEEMSRKDAAAGRNSQYGVRTSDFLARVAKERADNAMRYTVGTSQAYANALNQDAAKYSGLSAAAQNVDYGSLISGVGTVWDAVSDWWE